MNGITTIRSRKIQEKLCLEFDGLQDVHSSMSQLSLSSTQAFAMWIDSVSLLFIACVTFSFLYDGELDGLFQQC